MPAASGWTTSKLRSSLWSFRVNSRRCLRFIACRLFCVGRQIAFLFFSCCLGFMLIFHGEFNSARPGRRPLHSLSIGVGPPSIQSPVLKPCSFIGQERGQSTFFDKVGHVSISFFPQLRGFGLTPRKSVSAYSG